MPIDPRDIYKKMLAQLGVVKSATPGEGEYGYAPGDPNRMLMNPADAIGKARVYGLKGADPFWYKDDGTMRDQKTVLEGVDPWMQRWKAMYDAGNLSPDEANSLADHYFRNVGVPVQLQSANRPQWLSDYIANFLRGLGATNVPGGGGGGADQQPL